MKAQGYRTVYTLSGGLEGWRDEVQFPALAENPTPFQAQRNEKLTALARHFGGQPRAGSATPDAPGPTVAMPRLEATPVATPSAPGKKKKEGC